MTDVLKSEVIAVINPSKGFALPDAVMGLVILAILVSVAAALCKDLVSTSRQGKDKPVSGVLTGQNYPPAF